MFRRKTGMFNDLERSVIESINEQTRISFVDLYEKLFPDLNITIDLLNKEQRQQFEYPDSVDFESKKADVIKIIYLINMFFEDKYIYLSALSNQETQNEKNEEADHIITLGKNNIENSENSNGIKKTNENVDIESIRIIVKFYNKNLISTTKLQRLQQNNFQYEPTAQFHKSLRIQSFAIVSSLLIGIFPWVCDKCIDDTQALTIKITDKKAFEKILDRIKNENKQYQGYSRDIHSYLQEIKKLNVHNGNNRDNLIHILTENKEFLDKLIKEIKSTK